MEFISIERPAGIESYTFIKLGPKLSLTIELLVLTKLIQLNTINFGKMFSGQFC